MEDVEGYERRGVRVLGIRFRVLGRRERFRVAISSSGWSLVRERESASVRKKKIRLKNLPQIEVFCFCFCEKLLGLVLGRYF